ncbi:hypothetical protein GCM10009718_18110 [Isoptericola halotolerans]
MASRVTRPASSSNWCRRVTTPPGKYAQGSLERHEELISLCAARDAEGAAAVASRLWEGLPADPAGDRPTAG